jgi:murein DD-endopeptidase MepM/ murein hydrolase activator NlpD
MRRFVLAFVVLGLALTPTPAHASADAWVWPVTGRVVRPFDPPASTYGPGHRGINIAARPDTPVRAAADGVVVFAGTIAHVRWIVVMHPDRIRTTYGALSATRVHPGERVRAGQTIARAARSGSVYFGVRIGPEYVDPLAYLEPRDLPTVVHLVPIEPGRVAHGYGFAA